MTDPRLAAVMAWGKALRAQKLARLRLRRRCCLGLGALVLSLGASIVFPPRPRLVWNASASAPIGLYRVMPGAHLARGDMVIAWAPYPARLLAARRNYLPFNVPLVKTVVGVPGDIICARDGAILVNGRLVAQRQARDGAGRPLPRWRGCEGLGPTRFLLLMEAAPSSFDGRYFGSSERADIIGRATLLWGGSGT
ncbi:S26 family signal peptidase [Sphingobium yanoikuyae]|uniref:Conjugative transfer signal peptidase TraF n=1 Tax=Sphingobium yanoikuyae ATCC 51230 TaxID=883163 RepID=K9D159_SPHYA|nr:S26 family signal peptidase [Sphingobium yanoikuyae]EKU72742.1 conjugative transfer signal peptidase TraF [Sphingobium yanoikuyae ATCC 51230]WQE08407.1 S26 family signal peptidase [Sphingobium yanoikuyae]